LETEQEETVFSGGVLLGVIARKAVWEKGGEGDSGRGQGESWGG